MRRRCRLTRLLPAVIASQAAVSLPAIDPARAQAATGGLEDIGSATTTAAGVPSNSPAVSTTTPTTAAEFAPSRPSLGQLQPTSTVGTEQLQKFTIPTSNYDDIVALTPSAMDQNPAGPGLQQDFGQSIRGLQYTQFSVLFDGVQVPPSPGNLSPQPAVYFMAHDLGSVVVNRGPGASSDIGSAVFGGFVSLTSPDLAQKASLTPYGTFGSFGTKLFGISGQSGDVKPLGDARVMLDLSREEAEGADTGISTERRNLFLKFDKPFGENTLVTGVVNLDNDVTHTPYGTTLPLLNAYGRNFALVSDPTSQSFSGYNRDEYTSDFEYLRVRSSLGDGFHLDNTVYTSGYYHRGTEGLDPDGNSPNLVNAVIYLNGRRTRVADDVPGTADKNDTRDEGDILKLDKTLPFGTAKVGVWFDHIDNSYNRYAVDFTRGTIAYTKKAPGRGVTPFNYIVFDTLTTADPYGEFTWTPTPTVTLDAGVKYNAVTRSLQAPINRSTAAYADDHAAFNRVLPSFSGNWRIRPDLSVYAQAAAGYLTPPLNVFYTSSVNSVAPSSTWSYQVGSVFQRKWINLGADLYYIDYNNIISHRTISGSNVLYYNSGGATYKGVEVEGTVKLGDGFAVYANGTLNDSAYDSNGNNLAQTPRRTAAIAGIYDRGSLFRPTDDLHALLIAKDVGPQYGQDSARIGAHDAYPIKEYNYLNFDIGYILPVIGRRLSFDVQTFNLLNHQSIIGLAGTTAGTPSLPTYWTNAGRSIFFSVAVTL